MKLTETYKNIVLFEQFRDADINHDGILSEKEIELYDKKDNLKKEYRENFHNEHKFNAKKHGLPLGLAGLFAGGAIASCAIGGLLATIATPVFAVGVIGSLFWTISNISTTDKQLQIKRAELNKQLQNLDEEYKKNM